MSGSFRKMILLPPLMARSSFAEMAMNPTLLEWWMRGPICLCVAVSQNETDESAKAAMNAPLLARAMDLGLLP